MAGVKKERGKKQPLCIKEMELERKVNNGKVDKIIGPNTTVTRYYET